MAIWSMNEPQVSPEHKLRQFVHKRGLPSPYNIFKAQQLILKNYGSSKLSTKDYLVQTRLYFQLDELLIDLLDGIYSNNTKLDKIVSDCKARGSKLVFVPTSKCTVLDLLAMFYINYTTLQNGSTIFHETQINDLLCRMSGMIRVRRGQSYLSARLNKEIKKSISNDPVITILSS
jgi:hypothetical protein